MFLLQLPYHRSGRQVAMHTPAPTRTIAFDTNRSVPRKILEVIVQDMLVVCRYLHSVEHKTTEHANIDIFITRCLRQPRGGDMYLRVT